MEKFSEDQFTKGTKENPRLPTWLLIAILIGIVSLIGAIGNWVVSSMQRGIEQGPFLQVTNREMSLFLWQNPEYMRSSRGIKTGYLPGFYSEGKAVLKPESVDEYVAAPPELLFQYHTWHRLLGSYVIPRPISKEEFVEFLRDCPEWSLEHWPKAPKEYQAILDSIDLGKETDLQKLPLPLKMAFFGWKNYYREGELINQTEMNLEELTAFLRDFPNYGRNYWRNLFPEYLSVLLTKQAGEIPEKQRPPFLRAAFYNWKKLEETKGKQRHIGAAAEA